MLTPQEIQSKKFEKAVFGGYDMSMVDDFLDSLFADYTALYKENAVLKGKMKVLVDKIEEYRSVDEAMRKALLAAQNMANDLIANAKKQSEELTSSARNEAESRVKEYRREVEQEKARLEEARKKAARFIDDAMRRHEQALQALEALKEEKQLVLEKEPADQQPVEPAAEARSAAEEEKTQAVPVDAVEYAEHFRRTSGDRGVAADPADEDTVELEARRFQKAVARAETAEPEDFDYSEEDEVFTPKPRFKFENLRFGDNYKGEDDKR